MNSLYGWRVPHPMGTTEGGAMELRGAVENTSVENRLLIVEDDRDLSTAITRLARNLGPSVEVDVATDTSQARSLMKERQYKLVLVDYKLEGPEPGVGIFFDAMDSQDDARFVMMSSLQVDRILGSPSPPPFLFIKKPFDADTCREILKDALA